MGQIICRDIEKHSEYEGCVELQRAVWGFPETDLVPSSIMVVLHRYGGTCIGAFDGERLVGFVCGFVGWKEGKPLHHSHMLGVHPDYRGRGLGEKLKWAQRERVLGQGMDLITWTFDPLQAPNANMNLNRLGVVVRQYLTNLYGESASPLHGGIATDRFVAEWWLGSPRVLAAREKRQPGRPGWEELPRANRTVAVGEFRRCEDELSLDLDADEFLVEIPSNVTEMIARERELARDWRLKTRSIFVSYFGRGFAVVGFHLAEDRSFYRLAGQPANE